MKQILPWGGTLVLAISVAVWLVWGPSLVTPEPESTTSLFESVFEPPAPTPSPTVRPVVSLDRAFDYVDSTLVQK